MAIEFLSRPSDSRFIEQVWTSSAVEQAPFLSVAQGRYEVVVSDLPGRRLVTLRGPETIPTWVDCPVGRWFGIRLSPGVRFRHVLAPSLMNLADVQLPVAADGSFGFGDFRCAELTLENAETVVSTLVRLGYIFEDDVVGVAVEQPDAGVSRRSVERHFRRATGLSLGQFRQIDRAREATILLRGGASIVDVVAEAGYYDQAHLARSLRRFIGLTATEIRRGDDQLSLLYKTGR